MENQRINIEDYRDTKDEHRGLWRTLDKPRGPWINIEDNGEQWTNIGDYREAMDKHRGLIMEKHWLNMEDYGETADKHRGLWRNNGQT